MLMVPVPVAAADIKNVVGPVTAETVAFPGIPVPESDIPTPRSAVEGTVTNWLPVAVETPLITN
jgi:hypothetical protein